MPVLKFVTTFVIARCVMAAMLWRWENHVVFQNMSRTRFQSTKSTGQFWQIASSDALASIHIGKCAGTSMDQWIASSLVQQVAGTGIHADISYILALGLHQPRIITWMREPGKRAASNILFWNTLSFTSGWTCRSCSLSEIIEGDHLASYKGAWNDGLGGTCWLAGVCPNGWYIHTSPDGADTVESQRRSHLLSNESHAVLAQAKANLEQTAWFGLLERVDESMEMLKWQTGAFSAGSLPHANGNYNEMYEKITEQDLVSLRKLMPLDVALYEHAQIIFDERWDNYRENKLNGIPADAAGLIPRTESQTTAMQAVVGLSRLNHGEFTPKAISKEVKDLPYDGKLSDFISGQDM